MSRINAPPPAARLLLDTCYQRSVELLQRNSTPAGILAATPSERAHGRHYASIFGRDAAICALGMAASGDATLAESARAGLCTLATHQAVNGQIPKYVKPEIGEVDFWYTGCIDATLWWLIAVKLYDRFVPGAGLAAELQPRLATALQWLACQEHQVWHLLQQNEASDWADVMPRSGFVLYTNALWYWVKKLYGLPEARATHSYANHLFSPAGNSVPEHRRARLLVHYIRNRTRAGTFYFSFVNFSFWGEEVDIFGNLLAALVGIADFSRAGRIAEALQGIGAHRPFPVRVVGVPLERDSPLWRLYMQRHKQNFPFQYHNGGIWPFVGGFWVMLLARLGREQKAWSELGRLAEANQVGDWQFNEWLHGQTGAPMGMPGQSWNAALYLLAHHVLAERLRLFD